VVVVDDDEDTREIVGAMLRAHGATTSLAGDIASALGLVESGNADVVISDIGLRGEDGCALAEELHARFPETASIALSAFADSSMREEAIAAGFRTFLSKPVDTSELVDAVLACQR
jgi:CheY-like chemotaxis protein